MKKLVITILAIGITAVSAFAQDLIVMRNSSTINAKIRTISQNDITYSKWSNIDGPTYTISKSEVSYIQYQNGERDVFNDTSRPQAGNSYGNTNSSYNGGYGSAGSYSSGNTNSSSNTSYGTNYNNTETSIGNYYGGYGNNVYNNNAYGTEPQPYTYSDNTASVVRNTRQGIVDPDAKRAKFRGYAYGQFDYIFQVGPAIMPAVELGVLCGGNTFVGFATGVKYFTSYNVFYIPALVLTRYYFKQGTISPFADAAIGVAIGQQAVFNIRLGGGLDIGKGSFGLGYERLYDVNMISVKAGFYFGK